MYSDKNATKGIIYRINFKNARTKVNKLIEEIEAMAWMKVGFSQQEIETLRKNYYYPDYPQHRESCLIKWPVSGFPQEKIENRTYKKFNPLKFTFEEIDKLVENNYQPGDLDTEGKYRGQNPFEKSKDEWDKILDQVNTRTEPNLNQHSDFGKNGLESNSLSDIKSPFNTQRNDDSSQKFDKGKGWPYKTITMSLFFVVCIVAILWFGFFKKKNPYKQQRKQIQ